MLPPTPDKGRVVIFVMKSRCDEGISLNEYSVTTPQLDNT